MLSLQLVSGMQGGDIAVGHGWADGAPGPGIKVAGDRCHLTGRLDVDRRYTTIQRVLEQADYRACMY